MQLTQSHRERVSLCTPTIHTERDGAAIVTTRMPCLHGWTMWSDGKILTPGAQSFQELATPPPPFCTPASFPASAHCFTAVLQTQHSSVVRNHWDHLGHRFLSPNARVSGLVGLKQRLPVFLSDGFPDDGDPTGSGTPL